MSGKSRLYHHAYRAGERLIDQSHCMATDAPPPIASMTLTNDIASAKLNSHCNAFVNDMARPRIESGKISDMST